MFFVKLCPFVVVHMCRADACRDVCRVHIIYYKKSIGMLEACL